MEGNAVILWTARICVALYAARYLVMCRHVPREKTSAAERWTWTAGWAILALHIAAAFHYRHDWNHAAAAEHVARVTEKVVGFYWAGGIWFNYALAVVWGADVLRMWRAAAWGRFWPVLTHGYLAMMFLSATVIFGPGWWWFVAFAYAVTAGVFSRPRRHSGR